MKVSQNKIEKNKTELKLNSNSNSNSDSEVNMNSFECPVLDQNRDFYMYKICTPKECIISHSCIGQKSVEFYPYKISCSNKECRSFSCKPCMEKWKTYSDKCPVCRKKLVHILW